MKRRRAREYALQILFQLELTNGELTKDVLEEFWKSHPEDEEVKKFTLDIVKATRENLQSIDEVIKKAAEHWSIQRMAVIDRNILRAAACELLYRKDIPVSVAINEAIEIARKYSTTESASFINGILDRIAHEASAVRSLKKYKVNHD